MQMKGGQFLCLKCYGSLPEKIRDGLKEKYHHNEQNDVCAA